jgi:formylglycine-generating enzyme required for sulfatase activity
MFEHWPASGDRVPLEACMRAVADCDLLIVIVAHRYGWVPDTTGVAAAYSITRLECEEALRHGKEVLAFIIDDNAPWPLELKEEYAAVEAVKRGIPNPAEFAAIRRNIAGLQEFKDWLRSRLIRANFRGAEDLRGEIIAALNDWKIRHASAATAELSGAADFTRYLRHMRELCGFIDIRGLQVGSGKVNKFSIEDLYIRTDLKTESAPSASAPVGEEQQIEVLLTHRRAVIIGDPGSGKTTLMRRIAHSLTAAWLRIRIDAALADFGMEGEPPLPILIRLSDLASLLERAAGSPGLDFPAAADSPEWLPVFMARMSSEYRWGLKAADFRELLEEGRSLVLLDGLDEAPSARVRKLLARLIENCARVYDQCRFVVTSRPKGYSAETTLRDFQQFEVQPLSDASIRVFLERWCEALFPDEPMRRDQHFQELHRAIDSRGEIRRMATNPVMLTALAVVHWNQKRIPDQRAELYESILTWLSRAREDRNGRMSAARCMSLLQAVALAMQTQPEGRAVEVRRRLAAEVIAEHSGELMDVDRAEEFLMEEELDSGIVVARGESVRFWHLSFQEYLAARAISALREQDQRSLLLSKARRLLAPEWRETVLLFAGILYHQGPEKLNAMLEAVVDLPDIAVSMSSEAGLVSLIGAIQRDLSAFQFAFRNSRFDRIRRRIMRIFDPEEHRSMDVEERLAAAEALGQSGDPRLDLEPWVELPAGAFLIGAQREDASAAGFDACALANELPCRTVPLPAMLVSRFPATVADFERFIAAGGYDDAKYWTAGGFGQWRRPEAWDAQSQFFNRPVVGVSWYEAQAWCRWAGWGVRLLLEAEWERTARGESGRLFPWGESAPAAQLLNYAKSDTADSGKRLFGRPTPVGFYPLGGTPEGIVDLAGNVMEWCEDEVQPGRRALRGGCFRSVDLFVRSSARGNLPPDSRTDFIGFRACLSYALPAPRNHAQHHTGPGNA